MTDTRLQWQMDEIGRHRIVSVTRSHTGTTHTEFGPWATYEGIATLNQDGNLYIAVTQYFEGCMPTEQVILVVSMPDTLPNVQVRLRPANR